MIIYIRPPTKIIHLDEIIGLKSIFFINYLLIDFIKALMISDL